MFKDNLLRLCEKRGITPQVLCQSLGIDLRTMNAWLDSSMPRRASLEKLAMYFCVEVEDLLADENYPFNLEDCPLNFDWTI